MRKHFDAKNKCPMLVTRIELTPEVKDFVLQNRVWKPPSVISERRRMTANELNECYKIEIGLLRGKEDEKFFQTVVEKYLGKSHMKLKHVVTDVSTERVHAEIKRWDRFVECIGQLYVYKAQLPKEEYHAYMFDESCGKSKIKTAIKIMKIAFPGIKLFTFKTIPKKEVKIIEMDTDEVVFTFVIESE